MISEVLKEGLTTDQEKYIEYIATYSDKVALEEKDYLKSGEAKNIKVRVKYKDDITASDLPTEDVTLNLKFQVTYIQADESAKEVVQLEFVPKYFAYGTPTKSSTTDYTRLRNTVFVGLATDNSLGVCINDSDLFCIKYNDYENSTKKLKTHFREDKCTSKSTELSCVSDLLTCTAYSSGIVYCGGNLPGNECNVTADGVSCY